MTSFAALFSGPNPRRRARVGVFVAAACAVAFFVAACSLFSGDVACDDETPCPSPRVCGVSGFCVNRVVSEGEGDIVVGEGEGDIVVGEGEGDIVVGEGEGDIVVGEGEGEGDIVAGEGEGEPPAPTCDGNARTGDYCAGDKVSNGVDDTLYRCTGPGPARAIFACPLGCTVAPAGQDDFCHATCNANASTGDYCAGDKVTGGVPGTLYRCTGPGNAVVKTQCAHGCTVAAAGQDDFCTP